ncbi:MAG: metal-dependent transcriptional regulator [Actinomycetota bacterium]|nr:metal-dependent transcriptional regulator [Actinomycetota bacterium]
MEENTPEKVCKPRVAPEAEKTQFEDEALEGLWELIEKNGENKVSPGLLNEEMGEPQASDLMAESGLITVTDGKVAFTESGRVRARDIIRRHRLAERLFADVLDLNNYEQDACRFEHAISSEVEEAICTLLGHPPTCPHGRPIPRGNCCRLYTRKITPLVSALSDSGVGGEFKVVFLRTPMIDRLASIGLVTGSTIKLLQKRPSYVLKIDETTIAIDEDVAKGIFVKENEGQKD